MPDNSETLTFVFKAQDDLTKTLVEQQKGLSATTSAYLKFGESLRTVKYPADQFQAISKVLSLAERGSKVWNTFSTEFQNSMKVVTEGLSNQQRGMALYQTQMDTLEQSIQAYRTIAEQDVERSAEAATALALLVTERQKLIDQGPQDIVSGAEKAAAEYAMATKSLKGFQDTQKQGVAGNTKFIQTLDRLADVLERIEGAGTGAAKAVTAATGAVAKAPAVAGAAAPAERARQAYVAGEQRRAEGRATGGRSPADQLAEAFAKFKPVEKYRQWAKLMDELGPRAAAALMGGIDEMKPTLSAAILSTVLKPFEKVGAVVKGWGTSIKEFMEEWKDTWKAGGVTGILRRAFDVSAKGFAKTAGKAISKTVEKGLGFLKTLGGTLLGPFKSILNITSILQPALDLMERALLPLIIPLQDMFQQIAATFFPVIQQLVPLVVELVQVALPLFLDLVKEIAPVIIRIAQQVLPPFIKILKAIMPIVTQVVKVLLKLAEAVLPILMTVLEALVGAVTWVFNAISSVVKTLSFGYIDLGQIEQPGAPKAAGPTGATTNAQALQQAGGAYGAGTPLVMDQDLTDRVVPAQGPETTSRRSAKEATTVAKAVAQTIPPAMKREPTTADKKKDWRGQQELVVGAIRSLETTLMRMFEKKSRERGFEPPVVVDFGGYAQYTR